MRVAALVQGFTRLCRFYQGVRNRWLNLIVRAPQGIQSHIDPLQAKMRRATNRKSSANEPVHDESGTKLNILEARTTKGGSMRMEVEQPAGACQHLRAADASLGL